MLHTFDTGTLIVSGRQVMPCPNLSLDRLRDVKAYSLVPFPIKHGLAQNVWEWGWTSTANAAFAIACWMQFCKHNPQHIDTAHQYCEAAINRTMLHHA